MRGHLMHGAQDRTRFMTTYQCGRTFVQPVCDQGFEFRLCLPDCDALLMQQVAMFWQSVRCVPDCNRLVRREIPTCTMI